MAITNFGRNLQFTPRHTYQPRSEAELLKILRKHRGQRIHAAGSLHSWSEAARSDDIYITLEHLNSVHVSRETTEPIATIGAGCQIKRVLAELDKQGLTLPSVGLISEQTIAGATATGTHGSGKHCLSQYLETVRIAHYDAATGEPTITEVTGGNDLAAARCSLGCLGIIISVTIRPRPQYQIEEWLGVHPDLPTTLALEADWPLQQFFYVPWLDKYLGQHRREVKAKRSWLASVYRVYWFLAIDLALHVMLRLIVQTLRSAGGAKFFFRYVALTTVPWRWHVVDKSQNQLIMEHELFRHIEMEIFVRRSQLAAALELLRQTIIEFAGKSADRYTHHYPVCVRRVLADETLISATSGGAEDFYALSLISYACPAQRASFFGFCDSVAASLTATFGARCHWGKYCPTPAAEIQQLYPRLPEFAAVCERFDPERRFANDWLQQLLLDPDAAQPQEARRVS